MSTSMPAGARQAIARSNELFDDVVRRLPEIARTRTLTPAVSRLERRRVQLTAAPPATLRPFARALRRPCPTSARRDPLRPETRQKCRKWMLRGECRTRRSSVALLQPEVI